MAITALQVTTQISLQVLDGMLVSFDSKLIKNINGNQYLQSFDDIITLPPATVDLQISTETVTNIQLLFMMSDQQLTVKLQPQGALLSDVQALTLAGANLPSLLAVNNLIAIYVSNPTANPAKLTVCGAGSVL